jgi:hypothetical protein
MWLAICAVTFATVIGLCVLATLAQGNARAGKVRLRL